MTTKDHSLATADRLRRRGTGRAPRHRSADVPFGFMLMPQYATERILREPSPISGRRSTRHRSGRIRAGQRRRDRDPRWAPTANSRCAPAISPAATAPTHRPPALGLCFEGAAFEDSSCSATLRWTGRCRTTTACVRCTGPTVRPTTSWSASLSRAAAATACRCSYPTNSPSAGRPRTGWHTGSRGRAPGAVPHSGRGGPACRPACDGLGHAVVVSVRISHRMADPYGHGRVFIAGTRPTFTRPPAGRA